MFEALGALLSGAWPYIAGGFALVLGVLGVTIYRKGGTDTRNAIENASAQRTIAAGNTRHEVDRDVARDPDVDRKLRDNWTRPD